MKLGAITDGIDDDLEKALQYMDSEELEYAELQFVWGEEIGGHSESDNTLIRNLLAKYGKKISCVTRHNFNGVTPLAIERESPEYAVRMDGFLDSLDVAEFLGAPLVRIMSFAGPTVIWGRHGADRWFANDNRAWPRMLKFLEEPIRLAADRDIRLVVETGVFSMVRSAALARKAIEDLQCDNLSVLWDPANCLYSGELPLDGYAQIQGHIGHIHIKDLSCDRVRGTIVNRALGRGDMGPWLEDLSAVLRQDGYDGVVSYESMYRQEPSGTFGEGFGESSARFKELFG